MKPTRSDHLSDAQLALRGLSRETDIVLDPEGRWFTGSQLVEHPGIAAGFARWIERTDAGRYVLRNDLHYVYVTVQGAPLHARSATLHEDGASLQLLGGEQEPLRPETLRQGPDGTLYADARDGTWPVRLSPEAVLALEPVLEDAPDGVRIRVGFFDGVIPVVDQPLDR